MVHLKELVQRCKAKERRAQYRLYDLYSPRLFALCLRYTDDRDDAHDVLQESFIRIFDKIGQLKDPEQLEAWLRRVTVSTAINHYHQNKKHQAAASLHAAMFTIADGTPDILSSLNSSELLRLVNSLPAGYKMVFNMFVIEGYSHKEIAELMKISEGTSKSQLNHAKAWLKSYLKREETVGDSLPMKPVAGDEHDLLPAVNK